MSVAEAQELRSGNEFGNIENLFAEHKLDVSQQPGHVSALSPSQIMVLTDPEFESSVLISSDEGASYQKYRLSFYVLSLLFHPAQEDWALAYSHDQKVRLRFMSHVFYLRATFSCVEFQ